jgi:hypothetical protein
MKESMSEAAKLMVDVITKDNRINSFFIWVKAYYIYYSNAVVWAILPWCNINKEAIALSLLASELTRRHAEVAAHVAAEEQLRK